MTTSTSYLAKSMRPRALHRHELIAQNILHKSPLYSKGVLIGNWVEECTECDENALSKQFPKKEDESYDPEMFECRHGERFLNKVNSEQGNVEATLSIGDNRNFTTTYDLMYKYLPKWYCQEDNNGTTTHKYVHDRDLTEYFGNITRWGLKEKKLKKWVCNIETDFERSIYERVFKRPKITDYLKAADRRARDGSFTKSFRYKMTKSK